MVGIALQMSCLHLHRRTDTKEWAFALKKTLNDFGVCVCTLIFYSFVYFPHECTKLRSSRIYSKVNGCNRHSEDVAYFSLIEHARLLDPLVFQVEMFVAVNVIFFANDWILVHAALVVCFSLSLSRSLNRRSLIHSLWIPYGSIWFTVHKLDPINGKEYTLCRSECRHQSDLNSRNAENSPRAFIKILFILVCKICYSACTCTHTQHHILKDFMLFTIRGLYGTLAEHTIYIISIKQFSSQWISMAEKFSLFLLLFSTRKPKLEIWLHDVSFCRSTISNHSKVDTLCTVFNQCAMKHHKLKWN